MSNLILANKYKQERNKVLVLICLSIFAILFFSGCNTNSDPTPIAVAQGEYIYRQHTDELFPIEPIIPLQRERYSWEEENSHPYPRITKEFFRCKGDYLHPMKLIPSGSETIPCFDCGGFQRHSLPLRDGQEFIYPILIDLLNYLQTKTGNRVIVTCGHCCPEHALYIDASNQTSKHLIGAEVDFYVEGMETQPEKLIDLIQAYYKEQDKYKGLKDYQEFKRYEGSKTNVAVKPWFNKEVFIKLVGEREGRDFDNQHPYAYITIQVRYDWDLQEPVVYSWSTAFHNFYRK